MPNTISNFAHFWVMYVGFLIHRNRTIVWRIWPNVFPLQLATRLKAVRVEGLTYFPLPLTSRRPPQLMRTSSWHVDTIVFLSSCNSSLTQLQRYFQQTRRQCFDHNFFIRHRNRVILDSLERGRRRRLMWSLAAALTLDRLPAVVILPVWQPSLHHHAVSYCC